jgi:subtilisin family serine protease
VPALGGTIGTVLDPVDRTVERTLDPLDRAAGGVAAGAARLAEQRISRLTALVRRNRATIEFDEAGEPARKGELLLLDPTDSDLAAVQSAGFSLLGRETLGELGIGVARLGVPDRMSLARAEAALRKLLPQANITADNLHLPASGSVSAADGGDAGTAPAIDTQVGLIDGAPGTAVRVGALRGFVTGAPRASDHGSATASLLQGAGARRIAVADVYGTDPAGGSAMAISRAIDWLIGRRARVISISLVGPNNPLLGRAIAAARARGVTFVAAVGNDGPAAPPAYPASYPGVIAVTGVDGRNRALIEAGRALHLDYAAPGADMLAANAAGRWLRVRGTSYAAPLVAARAAAALAAGETVMPALDREAVDLGRKGADSTYGRGLLCGSCRRTR